MDETTSPFNKAPGSDPRTPANFRPPYAEEDYDLGKGGGYGSGFNLEELLNSEAYIENVQNIPSDPPLDDIPVEEEERLGKEAEDKEEAMFMNKFSEVVERASAKAVNTALKAYGVMPVTNGRDVHSYRDDAPPPNTTVPPNSRVINGLILRSTPRTQAEMAQGKCVISRFQRGGLNNADKRKIKERSVVKLHYTFRLMNFAKIMDHDGASSLGSQVLAAKCAMMGLLKWMDSYDVGHILADTPNTQLFHNTEHVARQPRIDLRKQANYRSVSVEQMASYQQFIHEWMSPTDIESSEWLFDVLQLSIESNLLLQLNQLHESYPEVQRGGVLFFKLLVDTLDANTFENVELYQDYIKDYKLSDTPDEDVGVSLSCFIAVHSMLDPRDVPSNIIRHMLNGQKHCAVKEYHDTVVGMLASVEGPLFDVYMQSMGGDHNKILHQFATKLKTKFTSLQTAKKWTLSTRSSGGAFFKANTNRETRAPPDANGFLQPNKSWQAWFDRQECEKCGKKGHPTKHCHDQGIRDRPWKPQSLTSLSNPSITRKNANPKHRAPRIKSGKVGDFKKRIYQAFADCIEDEDAEMLANMADLVEHVNVATDEGDDEPDRETQDNDDEDPDPPAMALAAMSLDLLLNYRAD